jgi:hypothetical protein
MKYPAKICALLLFAALCGCGKYGELEPRPGAKPIPVAYGSDKPATADELVTPSPQERPGRSAELLRRSERRAVDPFDLPPGGQPEADPTMPALPVPATPDASLPTPNLR